jgi:hypothetical protein
MPQRQIDKRRTFCFNRLETVRDIELMAQPQRAAQPIRRRVMKSRDESRSSWTIQEQGLSHRRLMTQVERLIDEPLDRKSTVAVRYYLEFEIFILTPHPRLPIDARSAYGKPIHRAPRAGIKPIQIRPIAKVQDQTEILRRAGAVHEMESHVKQRHSHGHALRHACN